MMDAAVCGGCGGCLQAIDFVVRRFGAVVDAAVCGGSKKLSKVNVRRFCGGYVSAPPHTPRRVYARARAARTSAYVRERLGRQRRRRLGELMAAQKEAVGLNQGAKGIGTSAGFLETRTQAPATLAEAGIDKNLAHRARTGRGRRNARAEGMAGGVVDATTICARVLGFLEKTTWARRSAFFAATSIFSRGGVVDYDQREQR